MSRWGAAGRGELVSKKPRPSPAGFSDRTMRLDQRARPPDTPRSGVIVVRPLRPTLRMASISRSAVVRSSRERVACGPRPQSRQTPGPRSM